MVERRSFHFLERAVSFRQKPTCWVRTWPPTSPIHRPKDSCQIRIHGWTPLTLGDDEKAFWFLFYKHKPPKRKSHLNRIWVCLPKQIKMIKMCLFQDFFWQNCPWLQDLCWWRQSNQRHCYLAWGTTWNQKKRTWPISILRFSGKSVIQTMGFLLTQSVKVSRYCSHCLPLSAIKWKIDLYKEIELSISISLLDVVYSSPSHDLSYQKMAMPFPEVYTPLGASL